MKPRPYVVIVRRYPLDRCDEREVSAYDARDAVYQVRVAIAHTGERVVGVRPKPQPTPEKS